MDIIDRAIAHTCIRSWGRSAMVHEWALAEAIVSYVKQKIDHGRRVKSLRIRLGVLQSIDREILDFALKTILESENIPVEKVEYIDEDVRLRCRRCGYKWTPKLDEVGEQIREAIHFVPEAAYSYFKCPRCGSRDFEIVSGRGLSIEGIEVE